MSYITMPGIKKFDPIDFNSIPDIVCNYYGLKKDVVYTRRRDGIIPLARFMIMYFLRSKTRLTLKQIGDQFGRDHTTVINAVRRIDDLLSINDDIVTNDMAILKSKMY